MKLITELIEYALRRDLLSEENKRKLQDEGFYTFYYDDDDGYNGYNEWLEARRERLERAHSPLETDPEDELGAASRRHGKGKSHASGPKLTGEQLNQRVQEEWDALTDRLPHIQGLWDAWEAGRLAQVLDVGFTLNDVYTLIDTELHDYSDFTGPAPATYRQLLRQVGTVSGKYSWLLKYPAIARMARFAPFLRELPREVKALYETDRAAFGRLSSQNGKLDFPGWELAVRTDTMSLRVWTILDITSHPVTPERIEEIQTRSSALGIALLLSPVFVTAMLAKLEVRDWTLLTVITDRKIENTTLKSVVIPKGVTEIGENAFRDCSSLTSVVIPEGVTVIGERAFFGCSSLTSVMIPEGVTKIGDYAFRGCSSLTSVVIPDSVQKIRDAVFAGCTALKQWSISSDHPYFKTDGTGLLTKDGKKLVACLASATEYRIPEGVTEIGWSAFRGCSSLTSVVIPEGVTEIGKYAFYDCSSLTSVVIPEGVTEIGSCAFWNCSSLTSVVIPESVTEIGENAFDECPNLTIQSE